MHPLHPVAVKTDLGPLTAHVGGQAGPWVMCWPTMVGDHRSMAAFANLLTDRHRVAVIDPPGFGASHSMAAWPAVSGHASLAHQALDALGAGPFHWIGHGFGGHVGAALAARVGYRMQSLTLSSVPFVQAARVTMLSQMLANLLYGSLLGRKIVASRMTRQMLPVRNPESRATYRQMLQTLNDCNPAVLRRLRPTPAVVLTRLREQLEPIGIPKLVLAGTHDTMVLPRDQRTLADVLHARYEEVDSGFMTFMVQPEACARAVLAFWQAHPQPAKN